MAFNDKDIICFDLRYIGNFLSSLGGFKSIVMDSPKSKQST